MNNRDFRFTLTDASSQLHPGHWDEVTAASGVFFSRPFLACMEQHLPPNLATHYALVYLKDRPVAAIVAQSLDIHLADLGANPLLPEEPGLWQGVGNAAKRSLSRARQRMLFYDQLIWEAPLGATFKLAEKGLWWDTFSRFLHQLWQLSELMAEKSVAYMHQRFLVCGNLLSSGPHGVAFSPSLDPKELWPGVIEALNRIWHSSPRFGESGLVMIKDLPGADPAAQAALQKASYHRFETEPNMVLDLDPAWHSLEDYLQALKSPYRRSIRKVFEELDAADITLEATHEVESLSQELHALYLQIHEHQKLRLVTLQSGWIPALSRMLGGYFRVVIARHKRSGACLGFMTVLNDQTEAMGYHVGFDKATAAKGVPLYLGLFYLGIDQAIQMKAQRLALGRTALGPKAQIGAKPQDLCGYLRFQNPALNLTVPGILALLPAPEQAHTRHPFKS